MLSQFSVISLLIAMLVNGATLLKGEDATGKASLTFSAGGYSDNLTDLYIMGLFPMEGSWAGGLGIMPAVQIALEHINDRLDILPGYRLNLIWDNTKVRFVL